MDEQLHSRYAIVKVIAPMSWLTSGGMCDEDEGWAEIWKDLAKSLKAGRPASLHNPVAVELTIAQKEGEIASSLKGFIDRKIDVCSVQRFTDGTERHVHFGRAMESGKNTSRSTLYRLLDAGCLRPGTPFDTVNTP